MTENHYCAYSGCRRLLVRRPGEPQRKFWKRTTCGNVCAALYGRRDLRGLGSAPPNPKMIPEPPWPQTVDVAQPDFSAHNLRFRRDSSRLARPDEARTLGGVGSRWMAP